MENENGKHTCAPQESYPDVHVNVQSTS